MNNNNKNLTLKCKSAKVSKNNPNEKLKTCFFSSTRPELSLWHTIKGLMCVFLGTERNLHCVNDYLTTINCSLSLSTPDGNSFYWLNITETSEKWESLLLMRIAGKQPIVVEQTQNFPSFFPSHAEWHVCASYKSWQRGNTSARSEYTTQSLVV